MNHDIHIRECTGVLPIVCGLLLSTLTYWLRNYLLNTKFVTHHLMNY